MRFAAWKLNQLTTAVLDSPSISNYYPPRNCFKWKKRKQSLGARLGPYGEWSKSFQRKFSLKQACLIFVNLNGDTPLTVLSIVHDRYTFHPPSQRHNVDSRSLHFMLVGESFQYPACTQFKMFKLFCDNGVEGFVSELRKFFSPRPSQ